MWQFDVLMQGAAIAHLDTYRCRVGIESAEAESGQQEVLASKGNWVNRVGVRSLGRQELEF